MGLFYFPGSGYKQSDVFGDRNGKHYGIDFAADAGTGIPAAVGGIVWRTGFSETFGYFVILKHEGANDKSFYTVYTHMLNNNFPPVDTKVEAGQKIGEVGDTGTASKGNHLHLEVYDPYNPNGDGVEPQKGSGGTPENPNGTSIINGNNNVDPDKFNKWPLGGPYDGGVCSDPNYHERSFFQRLYDLVYGIPDSFNRYFTRATQWVWPSREPLTLDLDGDGIETVGINTNNPILFDHDADGVKTATGWVKSDDGLLVLDRNGNGTIDNGRELFGDSTVMSNGQTAADGFAALADLDSNADGQIDVNDTQFANLKVWRDLNQDGISQANELSTLDQQNIASVSLTTTQNNQLLPDGNRILDLGTYTKTDGTTGTKLLAVSF